MAVLKTQNNTLNFNNLFDGVFETYDKFGRYGFNLMNERPNGAENV